MDAKEFWKEFGRMCDSHLCGDCPAKDLYCSHTMAFNANNDTSIVDAVEKWLKEHPRKTRQSEFLEQFPKTPCIGSGEIRLYPCQLGHRLVFDSHGYKFVPDGGECETKSCMGCRENFWNELVK